MENYEEHVVYGQGYPEEEGYTTVKKTIKKTKIVTKSPEYVTVTKQPGKYIEKKEKKIQENTTKYVKGKTEDHNYNYYESSSLTSKTRKYIPPVEEKKYIPPKQIIRESGRALKNREDAGDNYKYFETVDCRIGGTANTKSVKALVKQRRRHGDPH